MAGGDRILAGLEDWLEVEELVESGGMGSIYRGRVRASGELVAVKVMTASGESAGARFEREAQMLAQLRHPGIVRYHRHGLTDDGIAYLAMEWLEGEDLRHRLTSSGLTPMASVRLIRRVAEALGYAHARGIVHRDLKPSNLFLIDGDVERVKVLDFGVARSLGSTQVTRTGAIIGTAAYMAPEQARGGDDVGPRSDIFALGCILYKCLTGRSPFVAAHPLAMIGQIMFSEAPRLRDARPELPASLDELVASMLAKDPAKRPADADELCRAIDALGSLTGMVARSVSAQPSLGLTETERRLMCLVLVGDALPSATDATQLDDATVEDNSFRTHADVGQTGESHSATLAALNAEVTRHGGQGGPMTNGTFVAAFMADGAATDLAVRAAECALSLRAVVPASPISVTTGREVFGGQLRLGDMLEHQSERLEQSRRDAEGMSRTGALPIELDATTAGLLDTRFYVTPGTERVSLLWKQLEATTKPRTLLGRETPCVGRDRELALLEEILDECIEEPVARSVLVTGPAGIGKSRLRYEFLQRVDDRDQPVDLWTAQAHPVGRPAELSLIGAAIRCALGIVAGEPTAVSRRKIRARVARHFSRDDALRMRDMLAALSEVDRASSGGVPSLDPTDVDGELGNRFVEFLRAECAVSPVLLLLEDVHWSDAASVRLVDHALRAMREAPLMVIATARPEVHQRFPGLWFDRGVEQVRLHALRRSTCNRYVRDALGEGATKEEVQALVQQSGGNAFFLEELVRAHVEGAEELPPTVLAMVQARLERFPSRVRRLLRAASVYGAEFTVAGIRALLDEPDADGDDAEQWLAFLEEQEVIARHPSRDAYLFVHAYIRDAAHAMLTEGDRVRAEQRAAAWLAEQH